MGCDKILDLLQISPYYCSDENWIAISEIYINLFDCYNEQYATLGLDKIKPYSLIADIYEEQKQYQKADDAYSKLYKIVSGRDKINKDTIVQMLLNIYKTAKKSQKNKHV